tara:strand:- start:712 stop:966 length:255 start_codon:yes stop_codon:yes gene_type:complete
MSNRLIDILEDKDKIDGMNENFHYRKNILPKLEKLRKLIGNITPRHTEDLEFVDDLRADLKVNPHHRITKLEMEHCNGLWKKYK